MNQSDHHSWCYDRPYQCGCGNSCRRGEDRWNDFSGNNGGSCNSRDEDSWYYERPLRRERNDWNTYDEERNNMYYPECSDQESDAWSQQFGCDDNDYWDGCQHCVPCEWSNCENDAEDSVQDGAINLSTSINVWQTGDARGGDANGGDCGGAGGTAGDGGTVTNSAVTTVVDVVVVVGSGNGNNNTGGDGTASPIALDLNGRKVDIRLNDNGQTFVNGEKLEEQQLADGTKVYVFRKEEVQEN